MRTFELRGHVPVPRDSCKLVAVLRGPPPPRSSGAGPRTARGSDDGDLEKLDVARRGHKWYFLKASYKHIKLNPKPPERNKHHITQTMKTNIIPTAWP